MIKNKSMLKIMLILGLTCILSSCGSDVNLSKCEINVKQGNSDIPCETGYFDFGNIPLYRSQLITFTIENEGIDELNLTDINKVLITGQNADEFELTTSQTDSVILPDKFTEFSINFKPKSMGNKTATVSIPNNDKDENPYTFAIVGNCTPPAPEMHIAQGSTDILCSTGSYNFGNVKVNHTTQALLFTIYNNGNENLILSGSPDKITISGNDASMFIIDETNTYSPVIGGSKTTFTISFNPTSAGVKTAKISILNNDSDENPYTFTLTGTGVAVPEINIKQGTTDILNGTGDYIFSDTLINESSSEITFTIENLGTATLHLSGNPNNVEITGTDASMFSVNLTSTSENIAPVSSTTFGVKFNPSSSGDRSAIISIPNNDDDENPYTFKIEGKCVQAEIDVLQGSKSIPNSTGICDMGGAIVNSGKDIEFTIENLGDGNLKLTGSPIVEITGANASEFSVNTSATQTSILPNKDTTFKIKCTPTSTGAKTATISIANNDVDENPYTFTLNATGTVYTEGDVNGDGLADLVVGANLNDAGGTNAGRVYIFFGKSNWNSSYDASVADVIITGEDGSDEFGNSISMAGDVNNDGFEDVVVGAHYDEIGGTKSGTVYIFFGRSSWKSSVDASEANVKLIGEDAEDQFGSNVTSGGDINNDGIKDIVVGALYDDNGGDSSGCAFIFFGRNQWISQIDASKADVKLIGENAYDWFGVGISSSGDINDDGISDVIIGASYEDEGGSKAGAAYIFFGRSNWASSIDASNANVKLLGEDTEDYFGRYISSSGDINKDGIDDLIIAADYDDDGGTSSGCAFIFFGKSVWSSKIDAAYSNVKIVGENGGDNFGRGVCVGKDIDNDGYCDLIIGALKADDGGDASGVSYIFLSSSSWSSVIDASLADVKLVGEKELDFFGKEVFINIDINNDGFNDLVIGANGDDVGGSQAGACYVFFGRSNWNSIIDASTANVKLVGEEAGDRFGSFHYGN